MGIPELPTDNLYKFMATFGFLIATLSFGYLAVSASTQSETIARLEVQGEVFDAISSAERAYYERRLKALTETSGIARLEADRLLDLAESQPEQISPAEVDTLALQSEKLSSDNETLLYEYERFIVQFEERALPLRQDLAASRAKLDDWRWLGVFLAITGLGGGAMSVCGFHMWYRNVQVYQDAILRRQAERPAEQSA